MIADEWRVPVLNEFRLAITDQSPIGAELFFNRVWWVSFGQDWISKLNLAFDAIKLMRNRHERRLQFDKYQLIENQMILFNIVIAPPPSHPSLYLL